MLKYKAELCAEAQEPSRWVAPLDKGVAPLNPGSGAGLARGEDERRQERREEERRQEERREEERSGGLPPT